MSTDCHTPLLLVKVQGGSSIRAHVCTRHILSCKGRTCDHLQLDYVFTHYFTFSFTRSLVQAPKSHRLGLGYQKKTKKLH